MYSRRIAELLEPFIGPPDARRLTPDALQHISTYIDLLQRWNQRVNLTAIRDEEQIVTRHFGESLFAARHLFPREDWEGYGFSRATSQPITETTLAAEGRPDAQEHKTPSAPALINDERPLFAFPERSEGTNDAVAVADLGSGAGFPGIPIKLWAPEISLTLIESNHKKATFLREVTRALTLTNVNIQTARAESLAGASFDVVTLRAVERFGSILPVGAALLAPQGRLAILIGQSQLPRAHSYLSTLNWSHPLLIPGSQSRVLAIAVATTLESDRTDRESKQ